MDIIGTAVSTGKALVERLIEYHKLRLSAVQRKRMYLLELKYNANLLDRIPEAPGRVTGSKPVEPALLAVIEALETQGLELLYGSVVDEATAKPWKKIRKEHLRAAESIYLSIKTLKVLLTLSAKDARNELKAVILTTRVNNLKTSINSLKAELESELES